MNSTTAKVIPGQIYLGNAAYYIHSTWILMLYINFHRLNNFVYTRILQTYLTEVLYYIIPISTIKNIVLWKKTEEIIHYVSVSCTFIIIV